MCRSAIYNYYSALSNDFLYDLAKRKLLWYVLLEIGLENPTAGLWRLNEVIAKNGKIVKFS